MEKLEKYEIVKEALKSTLEAKKGILCLLEEGKVTAEQVFNYNGTTKEQLEKAITKYSLVLKETESVIEHVKNRYL